jgi:hypothetical protein
MSKTFSCIEEFERANSYTKGELEQLLDNHLLVEQKSQRTAHRLCMLLTMNLIIGIVGLIGLAASYFH